MSHCHDHHHDQPFDRAFLIAIVANSLFVVAQVVYAFYANSTGLLADAIHNLGDVMGLVLAWVAIVLMRRKATSKATYGYKKTSILAAMANGLFLVFTCGIIAAESVVKFVSAPPVDGVVVMWVAALGILVNGASAVLFWRGGHDLNIKAAFLHLFYDALISLGVVISGACIYWKGWNWVDPLTGLLIAGIILYGTWGIFKDSLRLVMDAVPKSISWHEVNDFFLAKPGVQGIHDLHIWALSTQENALSVHVFMPDMVLEDRDRARWIEELRQLFGISHVTIQVERTQTDCFDACP